MSHSPSSTSADPPKAPSMAASNSPVSTQDADEVTDRVSRPSVSFASVGVAAAPRDARRSSIQFAPSIDTTPVSKPKVPSLKLQRRMSSPPPPSTYESRVSFDTFDNKNATDISFTLVSKHKDYVYTRRSRTFLCGTDQNDYSEFALEWLVEELVEDGDEIVCLRVVDKDSKIASNPSVQQGIYKDEARSLLESVQKKNEEGKAISLVLELAVGKVPETIQRMIQVYAPTSLIVGTRGRSLGGISGLLPGSVSKYCLQNSPVPVVVVRPEDKRTKKREKRLANPTRQGYSSILSNATAGAFDTLAGSGTHQSVGTASEGEAQAVAKAIGIKEKAFGNWKGFDREGGESGEGAPLSRCASGRSEVGTEDSPSPTGPLVMDEEGLEEVPDLEELGTPVLSEAEGGEDEEGEEDVEAGFKELNLTEKGDKGDE